MAVEMKYTCEVRKEDFLKVRKVNKVISINGDINNKEVEIVFDIPTAIKFAKALRIAINEVKEAKNV